MRGLIYKELKMSEMRGSVVIMLLIAFVFALIDPVPLTFAIEDQIEASQMLGTALFATGIITAMFVGLMVSGIGFSMKDTMAQNRFYTTTPAGVSGVLASKYAANFIATAGVGAAAELANIFGRLIAPYKPDLTGVIVFCFSLLLINSASSLTMAAWFGNKRKNTALSIFLGILALISFLYFLFGDITPYLEIMFPEKEPDTAEMIQKLTSSGLFRTLSAVIAASVSVIVFVISYFIGLPGYRRQIDRGLED